MPRNSTIFLILLITVLIGCTNANNSSTIITSGIPEPTLMTYTVTNMYPHDTASFIEGLEWHNGFLYESTGDPDQRGMSKLARVDIKTGKDLQKINLPKQYFGEGMTILKGKIYQLTYKTQKCFVYDSATFKKINEFSYDGEGWGMTNDGKYLIMDNSSNNLYYRDPETFKIVKTVGVIDNNGYLDSINELEFVGGFIYSNVFMKDIIVKIDTATGHVVAKADLSNILQKNIPNFQQANIDVLNGIAYNKQSNKFYITGKYWPKVFEITFN